MSRTVHRGIRQCPCRDCRESPKSATAEQHRTINRVVASFDEKGRRLFVAYLASQSGRGAIEHLAQITGMSPNTIRRGLADQKQPLEDSPYRVRQPGGGRKPVEKKDPAVIQALENLLQDVTAGDPSTGMKWTHKSIRRLCRTLRRRGSPLVGPPFGVCCISVSIACERIANGWLGHTTRIGTASFDTWSVSDIAI